MNLHYIPWQSPIGRLHLVATDYALRILTFDANWAKIKATVGADLVESSNGILEQTIAELSEYFAKKRKEFSVPVEPLGTDFQKAAWRCLAKIPYGEIWSYLDQAKRLKKPTAVRAVGAANGRNPIGIIIPCHRVLGGSGQLTGYAGGLENKRKLLEVEGSFFVR
jgi:methylated-DNA-[protein]-cysteine S-methyltransferase